MCEQCKDEPYPCCWNGYCQASEFGMCVCCGAEMFEENGCWFHHSQAEIPFEDRVSQYPPINSQKA